MIIKTRHLHNPPRILAKGGDQRVIVSFDPYQTPVANHENAAQALMVALGVRESTRLRMGNGFWFICLQSCEHRLQ